MENIKTFAFVLFLVVSLAIPLHTSYADINDDGSFYVASWNLQNLGPTKANRQADLGRYVTEILSHAYAPRGYDIIFFQELQGSSTPTSLETLCAHPQITQVYHCDRAPFSDIYKPIGNNPPGYYNRQAGNNEYYGVMYKKNLEGGQILEGLIEDTAHSFSNTPIGASYTDYVARPPMEADFTITDTGSNENHQFTFLNSHITFNKNYGPPLEPNLSQNRKLQKNIQSEIEIINNYINTHVLPLNPSQKVVFLGDMNAGVLTDNMHHNIYSWSSLGFPAFNPPHWNRQVFESYVVTTPAGSAHDKIILDLSAQNKYSSPNDRGVAGTGNGVSDHNLIWIKFDLSPAQLIINGAQKRSDTGDFLAVEGHPAKRPRLDDGSRHLSSIDNTLNLYIVKKTQANSGALYKTVSVNQVTTNTNSDGEFDWTTAWPNPTLSAVNISIGGYSIQEFYVMADTDNDGKISETDKKVYFTVYKKQSPSDPEPKQPVRPPTQRYPVADPPGTVWFSVGEPINIKLPHSQKWFPYTPNVNIPHPDNGHSFTQQELDEMTNIFEQLVMFAAQTLLVEVGIEAILAPEFLEVEIPADIIANSALLTNKAKILLGESSTISQAYNTEKQARLAEDMFNVIKSNPSYVLKDMLYMGEKFIYDKSSLLPAFLRPDSPTKPYIQIPAEFNTKIKNQITPRLYIINYGQGIIPSMLDDVRGSTAYNEIKLYDNIQHTEFTWQNPTSGKYTIILDVDGDGNYDKDHDVMNPHGFSVGSHKIGTIHSGTYDHDTNSINVQDATVPQSHDVKLESDCKIVIDNFSTGKNSQFQTNSKHIEYKPGMEISGSYSHTTNTEYQLCTS